MTTFDVNKTPEKMAMSLQLDLKKFEKATDEEKKQQDVMSESTTFLKDGMKKLFKNPLAVASIIVLAFIIVTITVAPHIVPYSYEEILSVEGKRDKGAKNLRPFEYSKAEQAYIEKGNFRFPHIFGTDEQCRDYFIRVIYGTRVSLVVGFFASLIVLLIGIVYGSISGYAGKCSEYIEYKKQLDSEKEAQEKLLRAEKAASAVQAASTSAPAPAKKKRSFKEQKEFESLEEEIALLEEKMTALESEMSGTDYEKVRIAGEEYKKTEELLAGKYERWEVLAELE